MAETQIIITAKDAATSVFRSIMLASRDLTAGLKGMGLALAGAMSADRIVSMVTETVKAQDAMGKLAQATGTSVEAISAYSYAAQLSGADSQVLSSGLRALSKNIVEAQRAGSDAAVVFKSMGVATKDTEGNLRSTEAILGDIADRLASYEEGPAKVDLATRLFGKSGNTLLPLLNQGSAGLSRLSEEASRAGVVLSSDMAAAAARVNDGLERLSARSEGVKNRIVGGLLPALEDVMDIMEESAASSENMNSGVSAVDTTFRVFASTLVQVKNYMLDIPWDIAVAAAKAMSGDIAGAGRKLSEVYDDAMEADAKRRKLAGESVPQRIDANAFFGINAPASTASGKSPVPDIATDAADKLAKASKLRLEALAARDALVQLDLKAQATAASLAGDVAGAESLTRRAESLKNLATVQRELLRIEDERAQLEKSGKSTPDAVAALDGQAAALKAQVPIYEKLTVLASELAAIQERARLREQASAHASTMAGLTGGTGVWDARRQSIASKYDTLREAPATSGFKGDWDKEQAAALAQVGRDLALAASQASEASARMRGNVAATAQAQMEQLEIERQLATTEEQRLLLTEQIAEAQARRDGDMAAGAQKGFREYAASATDGFGQAESAAMSCFSTMSDGLARTIVLGDGLGNTLQNLSLRLTSMMLDMQVLGPMAKVMSGSSFADAGGLLSIFSGFHEGGTVGRDGTPRAVSPLVFAGARRYHSGGLVGGERPIIAKDGEEVLTEFDPRHIRNLGRSTGQTVYAPSFKADFNMTVQGSTGNASRDENYAKGLTTTITKGLDAWFDDKLQAAMRPGGKLNRGTSL